MFQSDKYDSIIFVLFKQVLLQEHIITHKNTRTLRVLLAISMSTLTFLSNLKFAETILRYDILKKSNVTCYVLHFEYFERTPTI